MRILLLLILVFTHQLFSQINDIIKPLRLNSGETTEYLISDLFYASSYNYIFEENSDIKIRYERKEKKLSVTPAINFEGGGMIRFYNSRDTFAIPLIVEKKTKHTFNYKPDAEAAKVNLFGSFNGWNRESHPMIDNDGDGIYETTISIDPGMYEYKFFVDGEEVVDPANPVSKPNGFGGWNSVISISAPAKEKIYIHNLRSVRNKNDLVLTFYLESELPLTAEDIFIFADNKLFNGNVKVTNKIVTVTVSNNLWNTVLKVIPSKEGVAGNIQVIDLQKLISPETFTWRDGIIYSIMIDRFFDGDKSNTKPVVHPELFKQANYQGGDLKGILLKLQEGYFDSLGINALWISPVVDNTDSAYQEYPAPHRYYTGYHGYWPVSSTEVESRFGDMKLLKQLTSEAHKRGIKVLLDFVANHIHIENPLWEDHRDWFGVLELPDGKLNLRLWDEQRLTTWFEPYMPSFDFEGSEKALEFMTDNAVWWLKETGVDGFRHDAVKHIPNRFWRRLTEKIKKEIKKEIYQIGETFGSYELVGSYVNHGQLNAQFNFLLYDTALPVFLLPDGSFNTLNGELHKSFSVFGIDNLMGNVMDSHDKVRYMAYADGDISFNDDAGEIGWNNPPQVNNKSSYDKLKLYQLYLNTIPGIPIIYYGDEIGMTGAADPDNRRMMRFNKDLSVWEKETLTDVRKIINIRKNSSALRQGDFIPLKVEKDLYIYFRSDMKEKIVVALNKSDNNVDVEIVIPSFYGVTGATDLWDNKNYLLNSSKFNVSVPAMGFRIFTVK
jgi:cyclomaltodextrinase / maltogenic alpha-amylase / neopullulanase